MNYFSWRFGKQGATACDESLAEHDKKYHPNGFDPERETCNKRAELAKADKGDVLSPSEGDDKGSDKPLVSAAEDAAYMDAVNRGDMETAAKMVREVAGRAMPETMVIDKDGLPKLYYHATYSDIKKFRQVSSRNCVFFAPSEEGAIAGVTASINERYGDQPRDGGGISGSLHLMPVFLDCHSIDGVDRDYPKKVKQFYELMPNRLENEDDIHKLLAKANEYDEEDAEAFREAARIAFRGEWTDDTGCDKKTWERITISSPFALVSVPDWSNESIFYKGKDLNPDAYHRAVAEEKGHDGFMVHDEGGYSIALWDGSKVKSADPVTYDDDGNLIPLSRRFDGGDDIRGDVSGGNKKG